MFEDIEIKRTVEQKQDGRIIHFGKNGEKSFIIKVAMSTKDNFEVDEEFAKFMALKVFVTEKMMAKPKQKQAYQRLFAEPISTGSTTGGVKVGIFSVPNLESHVGLMKLQHDFGIDPYSSAWIIEKILKLYSLFELMSEEALQDCRLYPYFDPKNFFVDPINHQVVYWNFSGEDILQNAEYPIKSVAQFFIEWLTKTIQDSTNGKIEEFTKLRATLQSLCGIFSFEDALEEFSEFIKETWGEENHPFAYKRYGSDNHWNHL